MAFAQEIEPEFENRFRRITVCSFCQTTFTNPKILPCFHTLCFKSNCRDENATLNIQSGSSAGPNCPICKAEFLIPKQGIAALPTNEYLDSIITTADALSHFPHVASYDGGDKKQRELCCQKHRKKFDSYCYNCAEILCHLCNRKGHLHHRVISVELAKKDLLQMIDNYWIGIESCHSYYKAQNSLCETAYEGATAAATENQMYSTPVRLDSRGNVNSGRYARTQPVSQSSCTSRNISNRLETSTCLESWKEYTRRFYEQITTRGSCSNISKITKELHKLHDAWRNSYEQVSPVQQSGSNNSPCVSKPASRRDIYNRSELEEKEQCKQISLPEQRKRMANENQLEDITMKQNEEKIRMEANLKKQELKYPELRTERDRPASELQIPKSKLNIAYELRLKTKVSPDKQTQHDYGSVVQQLHSVNAQQKFLDTTKKWEEYYLSEKAMWDKTEIQLIREIERLENQTYTLDKEKEYFATQHITEQESHKRSKDQLSETFKEKFEWEHQKELCVELLKQLRLQKETLEAVLKEQQESNADIQNKLTERLQNEKQQKRELEQLIFWIEQIDTQSAEFQMTTGCDLENGIIEKLKVSIIKKRKELTEKERLLMDRIEKVKYQMEELKSRATSEQMTQQIKNSNVAMKEREWSIREKQLCDSVEKTKRQNDQLQEAVTQFKETNSSAQRELEAAVRREGNLTAELTDLKQRLGQYLADKKQENYTGILRELKNLIKWIERGDKQPTEGQMTTEGESENSTIKKIKVSIIETTKELRNKEKQSLQAIEESDQQVTALRQRLANEETNRRKSDKEIASERDKLMENVQLLKNSEKQLNAKVQELENQIQMTKLKPQDLNTKNICDDSNAVQIVANRMSTLRAPTGVRNMGNTGYFGTTIQNLVRTVLLNEELLLNLSKQPPLDIELTNAYIEFLSTGYEANCDQIFRQMFKEFCKKSSRFADRGQHDSHILFVDFLNCLRDEERGHRWSFNSPDIQNVLTAVDKVFGGHTITVYVCSTCNTPYNVCEPLLDISVPILGPEDGGEDEEEDMFTTHLHNPDTERQAVEATMRPLGVRSRLRAPQRIFQKRSLMSGSMGETSMKQCLLYYSRIERIHDEYLCSRCESAGQPPMTSALKRTLIYNPPAVLVLHLKRFEQTTVGFKKCNQHVTYDEYLDIGPYCSSSCLRISDPNDANVWYSLYGVVVHIGSLTAGHYISYIKVRDCDTRQTKQFMQQTLLNRDQILNEDDIRRVNASRGMDTSRKECEPAEVEGRWYLADDEYVRAVEKTEALSQSAYLLFYERVAKSKDSFV